MVWQSRKRGPAPSRGGFSFFSWASFGKSLRSTSWVDSEDRSTNENGLNDIVSGYKSVHDPKPQDTPREPTNEESQPHASSDQLSWIEKEKVRVLSRSKALGQGGAQQGPFSAREFPKPCPYRHSVRTGQHLSVPTENSDATSGVRDTPELGVGSFVTSHLSEPSPLIISKADTTHSWDSATSTQVGSSSFAGDGDSEVAEDIRHVRQERNACASSRGGLPLARTVTEGSAIESLRSKFTEVFADPKLNPVTPLDRKGLEDWLNRTSSDGLGATSRSSTDKDIARAKLKQGRTRRWFAKNIGGKFGRNRHR